MDGIELVNATLRESDDESVPDRFVVEGQLINLSATRQPTPNIVLSSIGILGMRHRPRIVYEGDGFVDAGQERAFSFHLEESAKAFDEFILDLESREKRENLPRYVSIVSHMLAHIVAYVLFL